MRKEKMAKKNECTIRNGPWDGSNISRFHAVNTSLWKDRST